MENLQDKINYTTVTEDVTYVTSQLYGELISENEALKAENARLQAIIDEANAQKPFIYRKEPHKGWPEYSEINEFSDGFGGGLALYAAPIPAQQSPAVAVPDEIELSYKAQDKYQTILDNQDWVKTDFDRMAIKAATKINVDMNVGLIDYYPATIFAKMVSGTNLTSPRITEQDAREIVESFGSTLGDIPLTYDHVDIWLKQKGLALIEKLNK